MIPTVFGAVVFLCGLLSGAKHAITWQMIFTLFGATAAISLPALGGSTITPAVMFIPFLVWRAWREVPNGYWRRVPRAGIYLFAAAAWGVLCAVFLPRILSGQVSVLTIDRTAPGMTATAIVPLRPVSGNITQSAYALGSVATFLAMRILLGTQERIRVFRDAVLTLTALDCFVAVLNLAQFYAGLPNLLAFTKTASYANFEDYEQAGLMRISGTFPEASAFASFTLSLFAFVSTLWFCGDRTRWTGLLTLGTLAFLIISTSTTAYVGLSIYLFLVFGALTWKTYLVGRLRRLRVLAIAFCLLVCAMGVVFAFETSLAKAILRVVDVFIVSKMESDSGMERAQWNAQAWSNFVDTYGLGVGLGSARASSYPIVLLSNLGLIGTLFYCWFVANVLSRARSTSDPIQQAARNAVLASLISASLSATVFELGVGFYAFAAAATAASLARRERETQEEGEVYVGVAA
jgi:hypothetical protein